MIKFSPYTTIYDLEVEFEALTEVIWTFSKNLTGIATQRQRFNIHIVLNESEQRDHLEGSIKSVWRYLDQSKLTSNSLQENKKLFLEFISNSFLHAADKLKWDRSLIELAYAKSLNEGIEFSYSSKPRLNKSRTSKAHIKLKLIKNKVQILIVFSTPNQSEENEVLLIETFQFQIDGLRTFRDAIWLADDEFGFSFANGISLTASRENLSVKWNQNYSEEELGFIKFLTYRTFDSEKRIEWINS